MPATPLITVVTVSYNCVATIERTILSVIAQNYDKLEYIIIDGGSNDGTVDVIKKYEGFISYWTTEPDKGIYDAMNKGLLHSNGEWVNFLNSGDVYYENDSLLKVTTFLGCNENIALVYGSVANLYQGNYGVIKKNISISEKEQPFNICHQSTFYRVSIFREITFDLRFKYCADSKSYIDLLNRGYKLLYVPIIVTIYESSDGVSSRRLIEVLKEKVSILKLKPTDVLWWKMNLKFRLRYLLMKIAGGQVYNYIYSRYSKFINNKLESR